VSVFVPDEDHDVLNLGFLFSSEWPYENLQDDTLKETFKAQIKGHLNEDLIQLDEDDIERTYSELTGTWY
jgi:hypothetical protein